MFFRKIPNEKDLLRKCKNCIFINEINYELKFVKLIFIESKANTFNRWKGKIIFYKYIYGKEFNFLIDKLFFRKIPNKKETV